MNEDFTDDLRLLTGSLISNEWEGKDYEIYTSVIDKLNSASEQIETLSNADTQGGHALRKLAFSAFLICLTKPRKEMVMYLVSLFALAFKWGQDSERIKNLVPRKDVVPN